MTIFDAATVLLLQIAAERGDAQAQASLGVAFRLGEGVPQNDAQAIYWFRRSAELGDANGQALLGGAYHEGRAVPKNPATAADWYRRAAEQGNVIAQRQLAILHAHGSGVGFFRISKMVSIGGGSERSFGANRLSRILFSRRRIAARLRRSRDVVRAGSTAGKCQRPVRSR